MPTCKADPALERAFVDGFAFPLGVYPVEAMAPKPGYTIQFEPADGDDDEGEWEEWPDRYVFDIVLPATRTPLFCHLALATMTDRLYPILDVLGQDAFREIDPYISYDLVGQDRILDAWRKYKDFFFEDGLVGFGAMSEEPFSYLFVDEHKIVTIRVEPHMKERIERLLRSFGLEPMEDPAGADAAAHEHRGVLLAPESQPELLTFEEIVEALKVDWQLLLNIDPDRNVDDEGKDLGVTHWRCVVRVEVENDDGPPQIKYAEVILDADCLRAAEEGALEAAEASDGAQDLMVEDVRVIEHDRLAEEQLREGLARYNLKPPHSPTTPHAPSALPGVAGEAEGEPAEDPDGAHEKASDKASERGNKGGRGKQGDKGSDKPADKANKARGSKNQPSQPRIPRPKAGYVHSVRWLE
jgi:hypothetical protein